MQEYQQRVIDEKQQVNDRAVALSLFIGTNQVFNTLPAEEQELLREQCEIMHEHSEVLGKRIALFDKETDKAK